MNVDAAGVAHENDRALRWLYAVANAPIFSFHDSFFQRNCHEKKKWVRWRRHIAISMLGRSRAQPLPHRHSSSASRSRNSVEACAFQYFFERKIIVPHKQCPVCEAIPVSSLATGWHKFLQAHSPL